MTRSYAHTFMLAFAAAALTVASAAPAQESGKQPSIFDRLFGGSERDGRAEDTRRLAQNSPADLTVRIDRLEAQIRQLTGVIEQLQYRNQQLEAQLKRMQEVAGPQASNQVQPSPLMRAPAPGTYTQSPPFVPGQAPSTAPGQSPPIVAGPTPPTASARRSDAFDPSQNPNAPGAPRTLGTLSAPPQNDQGANVADSAIGAPGGRQPGTPLDLTTMGNNQSNDPALSEPNILPAPPTRNLSSTGVVASTLPPSATPRDQFDLGYGYIQRKDYALAEDAFQTFLSKYPTDRLTPDAQFWLGESRFQRQRYDAAAESFLAVSTKHISNAKAPDAMLRLGQSLAALGQKEMACATLAEVGRKFPRASASVRQGVEREQKRVHC